MTIIKVTGWYVVETENRRFVAFLSRGLSTSVSLIDGVFSTRRLAEAAL